ncbi:hypothetical protein GGR56DRAFT_649316 [Xylariaceae sp. FL0804]|nr:hypothetical protein GGR56DRAFT_649316 [Xylariaceae sp. FL0804]
MKLHSEASTLLGYPEIDKACSATSHSASSGSQHRHGRPRRCKKSEYTRLHVCHPGTGGALFCAQSQLCLNHSTSRQASRAESGERRLICCRQACRSAVDASGGSGGAVLVVRAGGGPKNADAGTIGICQGASSHVGAGRRARGAARYSSLNKASGTHKAMHHTPINVQSSRTPGPGCIPSVLKPPPEWAEGGSTPGHPTLPPRLPIQRHVCPVSPMTCARLGTSPPNHRPCRRLGLV